MQFRYKEIFYLSCLTYLFLSIIYPQYFIFAEIRFNSAHSNALAQLSSLNNINYLNNLNFTFWNFFDHTNHSYEHITMGLYTLYASIESIFFNILKFFVTDKAKLFHFVHTYVYSFLSIVLKTIGVVLICNFYKIKKILYLPIIISINGSLTFISYMGFENSFLYSLSIILLYFLIVFYNRPNILPLIYFSIFYFFCFSQSPLQSLSYFFAPFYFLIALSLIALVFNKSVDLKNFFNLKNHNLNLKLIIISIIIIIVFNILYFLVLTETQTLTEQGVNEKSRFDKILNPIAYFKIYVPTYRSPEMYLSFFNFLENKWWNKPLFIGIFSFHMALIGMIYSNRKEKYYFLITIIYILALQGPRDILFFDLSFYANLFNGILNPFSFLNQHTHMMLLLLPFFLAPLIIYGFESLYNLKHSKNLKKKNFLFLILNLFIFLYFILNKLDFYVIYVFLFFFVCLFSYLVFDIKKEKIFFILVLILIVADGHNMKKYIENIPLTGEKIIKRKILNLDENKKYILDLQNPIFNKLPLELVVKKPEIEKIYKINIFSDDYFNRQVSSGLFYKNTLLFNLMKEPYIYEQRHKVYTNMSNDNLLKDEILKSSNKNFTLFKVYHNDNDDNNYKSKFISIDPKTIILVKDLDDKILYKFKNPKEFPRYLYSNIFSNILTVGLNVNGQKYFPIQKIPKEYLYFDTNNAEDQFTFFVFPKNKKITSVGLSFTHYNYINDIWKNGDKIMISLNTPTEGYLLVRQPYNQFWGAKTNSKKIKIKRLDKYWLGLETQKGENIIELEYSLNKYFLNNFTVIIYYIATLFIFLSICRRKKFYN